MSNPTRSQKNNLMCFYVMFLFSVDDPITEVIILLHYFGKKFELINNFKLSGEKYMLLGFHSMFHFFGKLIYSLTEK